MGIFEDIFKYITSKKNKQQEEPNPELWKKFSSWNKSFVNSVVKELFVPEDISEEEVFEVLEYVGKYHPAIAARFTHIFFNKNIKSVPDNMFDGWKFEFVDFSNSPQLKIGKGAFANTPNLRIVNFFDPKNLKKDEKGTRLDIDNNAFLNSNIESIVCRVPAELHMPITNEIGKKKPFTIYISDPDIIINGNEDEHYHNTKFSLIGSNCILNNPLFITLKKYGYEYEFSVGNEKRTSYFIDEKNIKKMLVSAFDEKTKTLVLDNLLADKIEDTRLINDAILSDEGLKINKVRHNFNKIVFDILKDNRFVCGQLEKLVFAIDNVDLPSFCLAGNESVKKVEIKAKGVGIERFALANSSVENVTGNYNMIGHRAFWASKITHLSIPPTCEIVGTDIIDHQCKVFISDPAKTKVDSYFINPDLLASDEPRRIVRKGVKNPTLYLGGKVSSCLNESINKYKRIHKINTIIENESTFNRNDFRESKVR